MEDETVDYMRELAGNQPSEKREIVELLLDPTRVDLATEIKENEILILSILEAWASNPYPSAPGLKGEDGEPYKHELVLDMVWKFKINRVSNERKSRDEVIKGMLSSHPEIDEGLLSRISNSVRNTLM